MDAPNRIWAWVDDLAGIVGQSDEPETPPNLPAGPNAISPFAEYILASEHDRLIAEKDAEIERMRHDRDNWRGLAKIALAQFDALSEMAPPPQKGLLLRRIKELAEIRALKESPDA